MIIGIFSQFSILTRDFSETGLKDVRDRKILHTDFLKFQYTIIQAILSGKSMKELTVTNEKIFRVCKAFTVKNNSHTDLRTSYVHLSEKGNQYREEDYENKILS